MAFAINTEYTLTEILKAKSPTGSYLPFIDVLSQAVPMIEEGYWEQANDTTSHEMLQIVTEPTGTLTRANEGIPWEAVSTKPVREQIALLESMSRIDTRLLAKAADPIRFRLDREKAHLRGMVKTFHNKIFYGNSSTDQKDINGLRVRYATAATGSVTDGGGTTNTWSIWIVKWGPDGAMFLYPKDATKTIEVKDLREQITYDTQTPPAPYTTMVSRFSWQFGLGIADPRCVKRLGKVNPTVFPDTTTAGENWLIDLIENLPQGNTDNTAIYAGPQMMAQLRKRLNTKSNLYFNLQNVWGRSQLTFQDLPIVRVDALGTDETGSL